MSDEFSVRRLECGHCGTELPVMGRYVSFQCGTCYKYWMITSEGLRPLHVFRAVPKEDPDGEPLLLPFWVIPVDNHRLRDEVESSLARRREISMTIASTTVEAETDDFDELAMEIAGIDPALKRAHFMRQISSVRKVPAGSELDHLLRKMESRESYFIYVPAFHTLNSFAYLKVGRIFTRRQPEYRITRSEKPGRTVMCALQAEEAVQLMDFVFISTLPDSIQESGEFLEDVHLEPSAPPRLVEFPFEAKGSALESLIGRFQISSRLVESDQPAAGAGAR